MIIHSMTATFGKLEHETLTLQPGLNVIAAPNEWGKSTWCAFLTAMLYGVETRERTTKGALADKEKYMPWSGKPMEGTVRLEYDGRDITIQRRSRGRIPMGEFQAFETRTGLSVPELTAENCGVKLLGVDKRVFLQTGFIRLSDLPLQQDENLTQRLRQIAATGDETGDMAMLGKRLRELKNQCRSPRGGQIPQTMNQIQELEQAQREREALIQRMAQLSAQSQSVRQELSELEQRRRVCLQHGGDVDRQQMEQAAQAAKDARDARDELERRCGDLPDMETLREKRDRAETLLEQLRDAAGSAPIPAMPVVMPGLLTVLGVLAAVILMTQKLYLWGGIAAALALIAGFTAGVLADRRKAMELKRRQEQRKRETRIEELTALLRDVGGQMALRQELETACRTAEQTRIRLQSMVSQAREAKQWAEEDHGPSLLETEERIACLNDRLRQTQIRLGQCQGRGESLPEEETIRRRLAQQRQRLKELEEYERAIGQGLAALEEAGREFQRRFAPRLTALAKTYLTRLTGGRYHRLTLGDDLTIRAGKESETTLHGAAWRSDGTADQMYLALRLAMWEILNPQGPLVLDDALARLDDERLACAMELLKELGQKRQILLFSCQQREKNLL